MPGGPVSPGAVSPGPALAGSARVTATVGGQQVPILEPGPAAKPGRPGTATVGGRPAGKVRGSRRRTAASAPVAAELPVARVAVDVPLAHLDRPFDYLVPARLAEAAVPGCRVRVRFAGQLTGGYLLERVSASDHPGRLAALERVVSPEPVLTPEIAALAREVADRYAGTLADVLRLAIPPRHARAEAESGLDHRPPPAPPPARPAAGPWARYPAGNAFLAALTDGRAPRAVWSALPGRDWP
jgi:primosomal protein N' (replication factor Y) (superfamily II helicase)